MSRTYRRQLLLREAVSEATSKVRKVRTYTHEWAEYLAPESACRPGCRACGKDLAKQERKAQRLKAKAQLRRQAKL